jgi:hypothetical protein
VRRSLRSASIDARGAIALAVAWALGACASVHESVQPSAPAHAEDVSVHAPSQLDLPTDADEQPAARAPVASPVAPPVVTTQPAEAEAAAPASEDPALSALLCAHYADFGKRDWTAFAAHFWPGATIFTIRQPPGGGHETVVSTTVADYVAEMEKLGAGAGRIEFQVSKPLCDSDGVVALARVPFAARTLDQTEPHPWRGADVFLLVRHESQWRIASLAFGSPTFDQ